MDGYWHDLGELLEAKQESSGVIYDQNGDATVAVTRHELKSAGYYLPRELGPGTYIRHRTSQMWIVIVT